MTEVRPPRGFRDFPPETVLVRRWVVDRIVDVFERYGFDPIETPVIEYWDVLKGKYGEEAENKLVWRFVDPFSGREYAFRYDLTVPLARYLATHRNTPLPFKRYQVGRVWRHERPQKSRYREFLQCDADIVGSPYPEADAEILNLIVDVMDSLGFRDYVVRVNDRRLLRGIYEDYLGVSDFYSVYITIDKLDKIGKDAVLERLSGMLSSSQLGVVEKLLDLRGDPSSVLGFVGEWFRGVKAVEEAVKFLDEVFSLVRDSSRIILDLSLVRGLEYYTGPIHEVVVKGVRVGSVAGGGRYDGLIGLFLGRDIPATGVSFGVDRIVDAGLELGLYRLDRKTVTDIYVIVLDREFWRLGWRLADELRRHGFRVSLDLARRKIDKVRKYAKTLQIPIIVYIGRREAEKNTATVYVRETGERIEVERNQLVEKLKEIIERKTKIPTKTHNKE